jgi:hypothetical protein
VVSAAIPFLLALTQQPLPGTEVTQRVVTAHTWVARLSRDMRDSIWPGFRPDTIPVLYVIREQGTLLLGWRGDPPEGFGALAGTPGAFWEPTAAAGAASTGTELAGRRAAQVVVDTQGIAALVGLTTHEAFHVFQAASRTTGRLFGQGENSFLVTSYPVFDAQNEAGMALEGRILAAAQGARTNAARRAFARQFLATRESRQRALNPELLAFEKLAELNEGLAEYTLVRSVLLAARYADFPDHAGAQRIQAEKLGELNHITGNPKLSIRLRFYITSPAMGALLDRLEGPAWKSRLISQNRTLQDVLAEASGYRAGEQALRRQAESTFVMATLRSAADSGVAGLRTFRRAQVDSILGAPGLLIVVRVEGSFLGLCGIDPQNLLQVEPGVLLHTRWVRPCAGNALQATFNTPVVQERDAQVLRAVVGADSTVKLTAGGQPVSLDGANLTGAADVRLESPLVSLTAARADVVRDGRTLTIKIR